MENSIIRVCVNKKKRLSPSFPKGSVVAPWKSVGLRSERSGVRNLPLPCCVFEQDTLLLESTDNIQE